MGLGPAYGFDDEVITPDTLPTLPLPVAASGQNLPTELPKDRVEPRFDNYYISRAIVCNTIVPEALDTLPGPARTTRTHELFSSNDLSRILFP